MRKLLFAIATSVLFGATLHAQEDTASVTYVPSSGVYILQYTVEGVTYIDTLIPKTKIDPVVKCAVSFESSNNLYTYSYTLSLLPSSQQYLLSFRLFYSAIIQQRQKPTARWDIFDVPGQNNIDWANTNIDTTGLHTATTDIGPGMSLSGFSLKSSGLPTIINSYLEGNAPGLAFTGEPPQKMEDLLSPIVDFPNNTVIRRTLGPSLPPSPFDSLKFLDTVKSYINQARSLNWITADTIKNKYLALTDSARAQIQRGSGQFARITLDSVIAKTKRDSSGAITSEAYALLRFNSESLKGHLPKMTDTSSVASAWNMVSVPVEVSDFRKAVLYPGAQSSAYWYKVGTGYVAKDTLANANGYWVKYTTPLPPQPLSFTGLKIEFLKVPVVTGWNMIGPISYDLSKTKIVPEDTAATKITSSFYGYKAGTGYFSADTLKEGKGYWIKVSGNGNLLINTSAQPVGTITQEKPPPGPGAPSAPTLLSPSNGVTGQSISPTLSWNASSGASFYELQVSTDSSFGTSFYDNANITATSQQVSGLAYSTVYYWRVNASNESGTSNWSSAWSFTTQAPPPPPPPCTCCTQSTTTLDQFTVTDAVGNGQSMYVNNGGKQLALGITDLELPPEPVADMFSARFQSNKFIESVPVGQATSAIPIMVKNVALPFTISWNILPDNKTKYWLTDPSSGQVRTLLTSTGSMQMTGTGNGVILLQAQASQPCQ